MIRLIIENLLLFLAPTLIYLAWVWLTRDTGKDGSELWAEAPFVWLAAAGAALVVVTIIAFSTTGGNRPDHGYEPPTMKDGKLVPGHKQ